MSIKSANINGIDYSNASPLETSQHELFVSKLLQLAMSSAALYVDRNKHSVDINRYESLREDFIVDFNHACQHSAINNQARSTTLNPEDYFNLYTRTLFQESVRLNALITPPFCKDSSNPALLQRSAT